MRRKVYDSPIRRPQEQVKQQQQQEPAKVKKDCGCNQRKQRS